MYSKRSKKGASSLLLPHANTVLRCAILCSFLPAVIYKGYFSRLSTTHTPFQTIGNAFLNGVQRGSRICNDGDSESRWFFVSFSLKKELSYCSTRVRDFVSVASFLYLKYVDCYCVQDMWTFYCIISLRFQNNK